MVNRMSISLPPELKAAIKQESKDRSVSEAAIVRMRLLDSYAREAADAGLHPTASHLRQLLHQPSPSAE